MFLFHMLAMGRGRQPVARMIAEFLQDRPASVFPQRESGAQPYAETLPTGREPRGAGGPRGFRSLHKMLPPHPARLAPDEQKYST